MNIEHEIDKALSNGDFERFMSLVNQEPLCKLFPKTGLIFPLVTAEQLRIIAYYATSGDPLTPAGSHHHNGDPDFPDTNGMTKRQVHLAAANGNNELCNRLQTELNTERQWLTLMVSKRRYRPSGNTGKPPRPIDVPSEAKRLYGIFALYNLTQIAQSYLEPTVIGFRFLHEFEQFKDREDGITIQDVFASTVWNLIQAHGQWVVLLDLKDAYGNLPHQAIRAVLTELDINHWERRRLIELVRIRTILPKGGLYKPHAYGIEQGHPASPFVFNLVMSYIVKKLKDEGIPMASYGDDVVLVTGSEAEAQKAFQAFRRVTDALGFQNVRALGGKDQKASRIINVAVEPVPLIKTFLVGADRIALTEGKVVELKGRLSTNPTIGKVKRKNRYKMVSKVTLETILTDRASLNPPAGLGDDPRPAARGQAEGGYHEEGNPQASTDLSRSISLIDEPCRETDGMGSPTIPSGTTHGKYMDGSSPLGTNLSCTDPTATASSSTTSTGQQAGQGLDGGTQYGGMSVPIRGHGSETGVTAGQKDVGRRVHSLPTSPPVLLMEPTPEDWNLLVEGRRLRAGDRYRNAIIDLRDITNHVPARRLPHAVAQLARAASWKGQAKLLVHPGDRWAFVEDNFPSLHRIGVEHHALGKVIVVRRGTEREDSKGTIRPRPLPPDVETVVLSIRRHRDDARQWSVRLRDGGNEETLSIKTVSTNPSIARLEAISKVLKGKTAATVAMPFDGLAGTVLLGKVQPRTRQVGLADAVRVMRRWRWRRDGEWLWGTMSSKIK